MDTLTATFQVPDWIQNGLETGEYERVGGVIRETDTGQITAWLRETDPSQPISVQNVSKTLSLLRTGDAVGVLNLAISAIGFTVLLNKVRHLEEAIAGQNNAIEQIHRKIDLSFYGNFVAAIQQANMAFITRNPETQRIAALQAINRFLEAQHFFESTLEVALKAESPSAESLLSTLFLAHTAELRCHLELGEVDVASARLLEASKVLSAASSRFIDSILKEVDMTNLWVLKDREQQLQLIIRVEKIEGNGSVSLSQVPIACKRTSSREYMEYHDKLKKQLGVVRMSRNNLAELSKMDLGFLAKLLFNMHSFTCQAAAAHLSRILEWKKVFISVQRSYYGDTMDKRAIGSHHFPRIELPSIRQERMSVGCLFAKAESVIEDMKRLEAYQNEIYGMKASNLSLQEWCSIKPSDKSANKDPSLFIIIPHN